MSKKKMYGMLAFIIFTFALLAIVIVYEFNQYSNKTNEKENLGVSETENTNVADTGNDSDSSSEEGEGTTDDTLQEGDDLSNSPNESPTNTPIVTEAPTKELWEDLTFVFAGDIYMSDYILNQYSRNGIDGVLSKDLQNEFENAHIAMVNQEFAFSNRGSKAKDKQFTFRVDPTNVSMFQDMNLDIVTLANNHSMDYGTEALVDSFDTLNKANIKYVGAGNNLEEAKETKYFDINNKKIAILAASRVIPVPEWNAYSNKPGLLTTYDPTNLIAEVKSAKEQSDLVVVYVHWGLEKHTTPEAYQRVLAKQYIDAGADLVIGSHPHVLQGIEYYNGKPIVYSLGNFMFYNSIEQTAVLKVIMNEANELKVQLIPCKADNALTYQVDDSLSKSKFYQYIEEISFDTLFDDNGFVVK
jgi:poly-gamma-glutamate capsule biosynthesis protein CapA/YwtB (metallophosphatase superfamily)